MVGRWELRTKNTPSEGPQKVEKYNGRLGGQFWDSEIFAALVKQEIGLWDAINEIRQWANGSSWWFQLTPVPVPSKQLRQFQKNRRILKIRSC